MKPNKKLFDCLEVITIPEIYDSAIRFKIVFIFKFISFLNGRSVEYFHIKLLNRKWPSNNIKIPEIRNKQSNKLNSLKDYSNNNKIKLFTAFEKTHDRQLVKS